MARIAGSKGYYTVALLDHTGQPTGHEWRFPSVTTILDAVVAKPKLMHWYYSTALKGMSELLGKYGAKVPRDYDSLKSLMRSEGHSPYAKRDSAGDLGNVVHRDLESLCAGRPVKPTVANQGLLNWWEGKGLSAADILATEEPLVSFKHGYAGTCDFIYKDPETGRVVLCDLKTSRFVHWTHFVQGEAYREAYAEAGGWVDLVSVLHVPQVTDAGDLNRRGRELRAPDVHFGVFKAILEIYQALPSDWTPEDMDGA